MRTGFSGWDIGGLHKGGERGGRYKTSGLDLVLPRKKLGKREKDPENRSRGSLGIGEGGLERRARDGNLPRRSWLVLPVGRHPRIGSGSRRRGRGKAGC